MTTMFQFRHVNRTSFPTKHIMVCEDDLDCQVNIMKHLRTIFAPQGLVQVTCVAGGLAAAGILSQCKIDLILLDHDMPIGNGPDLIGWMKKWEVKTPIITFSGIKENNDVLRSLGAEHYFGKYDVIGGKADDVIKAVLGIE